ncbi:MAG: hypothetical protein NHB32_23030 [Fischerella sp. CENA71]|nr:hypothetical protein [Fischerella sp. CENA71]
MTTFAPRFHKLSLSYRKLFAVIEPQLKDLFSQEIFQTGITTECVTY